jgi:hypothetical protein
MLPQYLVRARAWWFNKVPLSVTLVLLLLDGTALTVPAALTVVLVVLTVCAVGNYGYASYSVLRQGVAQRLSGRRLNDNVTDGLDLFVDVSVHPERTSDAHATSIG